MDATKYRVFPQTVRDWADTIVTITSKTVPNQTVRRLDFVKIRNGRDRLPIELRRDENFCHHVLGEDAGPFSPTEVRRVLQERFNGEVDKKEQLVRAVAEEAQCAEKTASRYVSKAIGKTIEEIREGRSKRYRVIVDIPESGVK